MAIAREQMELVLVQENQILMLLLLTVESLAPLISPLIINGQMVKQVGFCPLETN